MFAWMKSQPFAYGTAAFLLTAAVVAGCGGGGGGYSAGPPPPTMPPAPSPTPQLLGTLNIATGGTVGSPVYGPAGTAGVVFSCGCSAQAGTGVTDASGNFTLVTVSTPTPAAPNPTYTIVPGRNYLAVATTGAGAEAWTIEFAGTVTGNNLGLDDSGTATHVGSIKSSIYTAAAALYIFQYSPVNNVAFDKWNFNTIETWVGHLKTAPNAAETTLLQDILNASVANSTLYPAAPTWHAGQATNSTIKTQLTNVHNSADALIPTPCPTAGGCTGTPTP